MPPAAAIAGAAIVGAGTSLISADKQSSAMENAASQQTAQGIMGIDFQREMFNKLLELNQPFYNIGKGAIPAYMNYLGLPYQQPATPTGGTGGISPKTLNLEKDASGIWKALSQPSTGSPSADNLSETIPQDSRYKPDHIPTLDTFEYTGGANYPPVNNLSRTVTPWTRFDREGSQTPTPPIFRAETMPEAYRPLDTSGYTGEAGNVPPGMEQYGPAFNSPMYQWRLQEGTNALNNALRARGKFDSTVGLRSIGDLTNQLTAEETEKSYNRLLDAIKIGSGAANTAGAGAIQTGQGVAGSFNNIGNALAAGQQGQGQAWGSFYSGLGGLPMQLASMNYLMNKPNTGYGNAYDEYYR